MDEPRFSKITFKILRKAGWFPGRHVFSSLRLPSGFELHVPARQVLDEFGGLSLKFYYSEKRGRRTHLDETTIIINPVRCSGENESIAEESQLIGHPLYPLGELVDDYYDPDGSKILIDDLGRVFIVSFFTAYFMGETFEISLDNMLSGRKGKIVNKNGNW
jgi:hypothetical protein